MSIEEAVNTSKETLEIQNVVASTGIENELDLQAMASDLEGADFDPDQFTGLIFRPSGRQGATSLIFRSGEIVCTGATSITGVHEEIHTTFDDLRDIGIRIEEPSEITVQNIVTSGDLGEALNLNAIAIGLGLENTEYEPEQFPGLIYRLDEPDVVTILFTSGKMVITGGKGPEEAEVAVEVIVSQLADLNLLR